MNQTKKANPIPKQNTVSLYGKVDLWLERNNKKLFWLLLALSAFLCLISFNARISEAHDDALYLEGGWRFVNEYPDYFYTQNAPLYPLFLGLLVKLFGFKLVLFKLFSVVFTLLGLTFLFKALYKRVPGVVFIPVVVFQAVNHLIMYYASMTFTEAFYFFLQGLFFYFSGDLIETVSQNGVQFKVQLKKWLLFGLSMFLLSTCKSAAIVAIPVVILFFAAERNWKALGFSLLSYGIIKGLYEVIVRTIWHGQSQFQDQSKILLQKDPYNRSLGNEDLSGFIQRFIDNSNLYIGKRFYQLLGIRDENYISEKTVMEEYGFVTFISIVIILIGLWFIIKHKKKHVAFFVLFSLAQASLSFIILAARWDQARIILVTMPMLLTAMLYAFYHFTNKPGIGQTLYAVIGITIIVSVNVSSFKRGLKNLPIVQKNLKGDTYFGYTPDWINFLKCSEWCADSLSKETLVASRKAPMSFVYGKGKKFFPVYSVIKKDPTTEQSHPDSALTFFKQNKVTHIMLPTLRLNPNDPSNGFINTIHNILAPIAQKYPQKLKLVHTEGAFEECALYEFDYDK
ncbi:MAG: hypothetical protein IPM51_06000 [Sphingobacteriaceae bacterium]|nr:hypothetical protein [Sphingobacteriaceae bacterium]